MSQFQRLCPHIPGGPLNPSCPVCYQHACTPGQKEHFDSLVGVSTPIPADFPCRGRVQKIIPLDTRPCIYGHRMSPQERETERVGHVREWKWCRHPAQPLGPIVCSCLGCGARCPEYKPDDEE